MKAHYVLTEQQQQQHTIQTWSVIYYVLYAEVGRGEGGNAATAAVVAVTERGLIAKMCSMNLCGVCRLRAIEKHKAFRERERGTERETE